jgi:hypothetical protein
MVVSKNKFCETVSKSYIPLKRSYDVKSITIAVNNIRQKIVDYITDIETDTGYAYYVGDMNGQNDAPVWIEKEFITDELHSIVTANIENIIYTYLDDNDILDKETINNL